VSTVIDPRGAISDLVLLVSALPTSTTRQKTSSRISLDGSPRLGLHSPRPMLAVFWANLQALSKKTVQRV